MNTLLDRSLNRRQASASSWVVIALAVAVGLTILFFKGYVKLGIGAKRETATIFVHSTLKPALLRYKAEMGDFPSTAEGLQALISAPKGTEGRWGGPYDNDDRQSPIDPWGHPYRYSHPGTHNQDSYDLWSAGGPSGDESETGTIGNW